MKTIEQLEVENQRLLDEISALAQKNALLSGTEYPLTRAEKIECDNGHKAMMDKIDACAAAEVANFKEKYPLAWRTGGLYIVSTCYYGKIWAVSGENTPAGKAYLYDRIYKNRVEEENANHF